MSEEKISICKQTRALAVEALHTALSDLLNKQTPFSEIQLRDLWLSEIRKHNELYTDGWYVPPPHGIGVLFGTTDHHSRHSYSSLRNKNTWPKSDVFFDGRNQLMYLYASPVDRKTGLIGDFGVTLYFGTNPVIIEYIQRCFELNKKIFDYIELNMKFCDITNFLNETYAELGLRNTVTSTTDPTGVNIGHTYPITYEDWNGNELKLLQQGEARWNDICTMISKKRVYLNEQEQFTVRPGMAFTIEPRPIILNDPNIPMISFHTMVIINQDGTKQFITNFDELFKLAGMNYLL